MNIEKLNDAKRVSVTFYKPKDVNGEFVKQFRKDNDLSQYELANILGVTQSAVAQWEKGNKKINGSATVLISLLCDYPWVLSELYRYEIKGGYKNA